MVDSTGWMSADLHVHAVNSTDSAVGNALRVSNFLAEGVDVLVSTDHEWVTDFAPTVRRARRRRTSWPSMIGEEITSFTHGHFNNFPLIRTGSNPNGGAFDHAGGETGPTLRMPQVFDGVHAAHPGSVVQLNHPRGGSGVLTLLRVDTATLATHGDPADYGMAPAPDATADDTRLLGDGWDVIETANGPSPSYAVLNDWMTFLSRGTVRTATGVSDTHYAYSATGGYARTYAKVGVDTPAQFTAGGLRRRDSRAPRLRDQRALLALHRAAARRGDEPGGRPGGDRRHAEGRRRASRCSSPSTCRAPEQAADRPGGDLLPRPRAARRSTARATATGPTGASSTSTCSTSPTRTLEAVPGSASLRRRAPAPRRSSSTPTKDTWYVAMARGTTGNSLWPLHGEPTGGLLQRHA